MSMFHELMMRKKEQIMYATIKGTLTENDGVFSGFSASNYLKTQTEFAPNNSTFEMLWKVKTPSSYNSHRNWIIANPENSSDYKGIAFGCNTNGDLSLYLSSTGASWNITASGNIVNLATDTDYWLKLKYDLSKYVVLVSTDGTNYTQVLSVSSSEKVFASSHIIGTNGYAYGQVWGGSIDLNKSYIKIDNTKYKLQAVVGYTKVGSPTITDGVVSGFSRANYLQINNQPLNNYDDFELVVRAKTTKVGGTQPLFVSGDSGLFYIQFRNDMLIVRVGDSSPVSILQYNFDLTTFYYIKVKRKGNFISVSISLDGVTYQDEVTKEAESFTTGGTNIQIGRGGFNWGVNVFFEGEIDMNNTYIKINNKLWFNGQQA